jgi:3-phenylpropionate/trans-cinnamate dioxygenase ferredoxin subunit
MGFVVIGNVKDVAKGELKAFSVSGKDLLVANVGGKFYAMDRYCPHAAGDLSIGTLEGSVVTCPKHGSKFDLAAGTTLNGPKIGFLKLKPSSSTYYEVKVEGTNILINI